MIINIKVFMMHKNSTFQWAIISISKQEGRKLLFCICGSDCGGALFWSWGALEGRSREDQDWVRLSTANPGIEWEQEWEPPSLSRGGPGNFPQELHLPCTSCASSSSQPLQCFLQVLWPPKEQESTDNMCQPHTGSMWVSLAGPVFNSLGYCWGEMGDSLRP